MLYNRLPFRGINVKEIKEKIVKCQYPLRDSISEEARDLIQGMLQKDPERRLRVE